jgi:hypothetical protein
MHIKKLNHVWAQTLAISQDKAVCSLLGEDLSAKLEVHCQQAGWKQWRIC